VIEPQQTPPDQRGLPDGLAAIIPAKDEVERVGRTVLAAREIPGVDVVIVVDDGSADNTAAAAREAGAAVISHRHNRGKAAAMATGGVAVGLLDAARAQMSSEPDRQSPAARGLLFLDADLAESAQGAAPLVDLVLAGQVDMTIALLPTQHASGGGRGRVVDLARQGIVTATGWLPTQPLSGIRCLSRRAFDAASPLAVGWGVETAMTIDLLRAGMRVREVPCELFHRVSGADLAGTLHRAAQYRDVARALAARGLLDLGLSRLLRPVPRSC